MLLRWINASVVAGLDSDGTLNGSRGKQVPARVILSQVKQQNFLIIRLPLTKTGVTIMCNTGGIDRVLRIIVGLALE